MPKVSVIIPVYNAEKYIKDCIDSVINQTFNDIEIICINDASTDDSLKILKEYESNNKNLTIISQKKLGVSAARNTGIKLAKSAFILFVDSDDILNKKAIETVYHSATATNADITIFGHQNMVQDKIIKNNINLLKNFEKDKSNMNTLLPLTNYVWDKLFKKEFLINNQVYFQEGIVASEDGYFILTCLSKKPEISTIPEILYTYRNNESCTTNNINMTGNSIDTLYSILNSNLFKNASNSLKELTLNKYINSISYWYDAQKQKKYRKSNRVKLKKLIKYLKENFENDNLIEKLRYLEFKIGYTSKFIEKIFSIKNYYIGGKKHKLIRILGLRFKLNVKNNKPKPVRSITTKYDGIIMNFWWSLNYGASLTAYALQEYLNSFGYTYSLLNFIHGWAEERYKNSFSEKFAKKHLKLTHKIKTKTDFQELNGCTDNFIVGSDQVFRYCYSKNNFFNYMLDYTNFSKKRIAFSVSFGTSQFGIKNVFIKLFTKQALKRFDFVSTREDSGVNICKNEFNVNAEHIIDPVFLIDNEKWQNLANESNNNYEGVITSYILDNRNSVDKFKTYISNKFNLPIVEFAGSGAFVEDFVKAFRDSEYIITDSFHGLCFALIFHKKFICILNTKRGTDRFTSLARTFKLDGVFLEDYNEIYNRDNIFTNYDYQIFENIVNYEKEKANEFLKKAINSQKIITDELITNELDFINNKFRKE